VLIRSFSVCEIWGNLLWHQSLPLLPWISWSELDINSFEDRSNLEKKTVFSLIIWTMSSSAVVMKLHPVTCPATPPPYWLVTTAAGVVVPPAMAG
jgi:hypothetical protein